ncbi:DNA polymerase delta, subunit 4-domain-containing protein [Neurospora hispaniola]|uniref:DNA polymerase delta, subunit 4-domain-containing protein n=1 Tax=Neurospora hispaniola TaxID=588809 RepID=A0AAJ0I4N8_9PEZI|nr:DNA polymerase delta, subunit 4-domain-containing protein [Neurospora hispaniola]
MPVTRKSTRSRGGAAAAAAQGKQQTLSFHHRVTKPTVKTGKDLIKEEEAPETATKTKTKDIKVEEGAIKEPEPSESEEEEEHEKKKKQPHAKVKKPAKKAATKHVKEETRQEEPKKQEKEDGPKRSEIELCALEIPQSAIDAYWNKIDSARMASTVHKKHTQDLTTGEKVLRYFDVSSHYGPCIGITRLKRWQRAEKLGLNPPLEVLAILLKEGEGENKASERAHMDELMNSVSTGP